MPEASASRDWRRDRFKLWWPFELTVKSSKSLRKFTMAFCYYSSTCIPLLLPHSIRYPGKPLMSYSKIIRIIRSLTVLITFDEERIFNLNG